ncbi:metal-dependent hydrolase [Zavarzinia compransoris]|uniref:metal-dependent hydrolase n=1 Tax=Zavarzinia marina TaxID=2911065 RepID=UPI001F32BFD1|nr:metal-dependent hydrolase [Zavarzinia marina]MCF4164910.1 metal-dependent hydrolase [Zavarzinia marina]
MASLTPITPRNITFKVDGTRTLWCDDDAARTAFFDGLSIMFPEGERFFMEAVRDNAAGITDPALKRDIQGFTTQEAIHSREHMRYNRMLTERVGEVVTRLEDAEKKRIEFAKRVMGPQQRLAMTIALEHFTAIMADHLLRFPHMLDGADPEMARLWRWHAIEESEHKAVAFDVYRAVYPGLGGYLRRIWLMLVTTTTFTFFMSVHINAIMKADGRATWGNRWRLVKLFWGRNGVITRTLPSWLAYFRPGFHPWMHDNRGLVDSHRARLDATA